MCLTKNTKNTCVTDKNITYIPHLILRFAVGARTKEVRYRHRVRKLSPNVFKITVEITKY